MCRVVVLAVDCIGGRDATILGEKIKISEVRWLRNRPFEPTKNKG